MPTPPDAKPAEPTFDSAMATIRELWRHNGAHWEFRDKRKSDPADPIILAEFAKQYEATRERAWRQEQSGNAVARILDGTFQGEPEHWSNASLVRDIMRERDKLKAELSAIGLVIAREKIGASK